MIIASIGSYDYRVECQEDAEALLRIFSRAQEIHTDYLNKKMHYYVSQNSTEIRVSICHRDLLSLQELEKLRELEAAKKQGEEEAHQ